MNASMRTLRLVGIIAALAWTLNGCGKKEEAGTSGSSQIPTSTAEQVNVTAITLGNGIGSQKKVVQAANAFGRNDTVYASVDTTGAGTTTLKAKWTYRANGQDVPVREDAQTINPTGPATSEFHVSKPDGWPTGDYKVEVSATGSASSARTFSVK
jgi:hypothetical protein